MLSSSLLLVVRGLPSLLVYRHDLEPRQRVEMTFITATSLPLLIALADIGQQDGVMLPATAAALVGAGVLSVLIYPLIAVGLYRSRMKTRPSPTASMKRRPRDRSVGRRGGPAVGAGQRPVRFLEHVRGVNWPRLWISLATSPVQPVWCEAPRPAPLSPWKYS